MPKPTLLVAGKLTGPVGRENPGIPPIDYIISMLKKHMSEFGGSPPVALADRVFIVKSETGSGKSTVLPSYIFRLLRSERTGKAVKLAGPGVMCTQPRILTAQTLAREQAADNVNYPDLVLGETVGYQTGPVNEKPASGLVYATAGALLAQLRTLSDTEIMARHRFIIVDEAHERSLDTDALLMRLKSFLLRNLGNIRLPFVVLASATISVGKYAAFFAVPPANTVEVSGRAFPVQIIYPETGTSNYPEEAAKVAIHIHETHPGDHPLRADVLIFMPGLAEIGAVVEALSNANERQQEPFQILVLSRGVVRAQGRDYRLIGENIAELPIPKDMKDRPRRIIVSTVVAETGLTIKTLKYVIDCGWSRVQETYYPGRIRGLITRPASLSRITQRKGRAGRLFPGEFYPLYTHNVHGNLPAEQLPDIVTAGIAPIFLDVITTTIAPTQDREVRLFRVEDIDMLDTPPTAALIAAMEESVVFGYLRAASTTSESGYQLTQLGELAARFTYLKMNQVQTLLSGYLWQVSMSDLAVIVALYEQRDAMLYAKAPPGPAWHSDNAVIQRQALSAGLPPFFREGLGAEDDPYDRAHLLLSDSFLEALIAFEGFVAAIERLEGDLPRLLDWCSNNGIDFDGATALAGMRDQVISEMIVAGLNPFWGDKFRLAKAPASAFFDTVVRLKHCIYAGLRFWLLTRDDSVDAYRALSGELVEPPDSRRPLRMVTNVIRLRGAKGDHRDRFRPLLYRLHPGMVSVLDGYVPIDDEMFLPRLNFSRQK